MKIAIYGGSFNPIHRGHIKVAKTAINDLKLNKLYFVPAYKNPFKHKKKYVDSHHRVNMVNLVKENKMEVSLFEINKKGFSYTIETIKYFKNKYPNDKLYLIIGSDNINKLNK
jgi:nicotinate-nucleotide adenylyltransferase